MEFHREQKMTTPDVYVGHAKGWTTVLEDAEARRTGDPIREARKRVARMLGLSSGTLENLRHRSPKAVATHVYDRLRGGVIRELEKELARVEQELHVARQTGLDPRHGVVQSALASQAKIRAALGLSDGGAS